MRGSGPTGGGTVLCTHQYEVRSMQVVEWNMVGSIEVGLEAGDW